MRKALSGSLTPAASSERQIISLQAMASEQKSGAEPPAAPTEEPELSEQEIIGRYRAMRTEIQKTAQKIAELEQDVGEHQ